MIPVLGKLLSLVMLQSMNPGFTNMMLTHLLVMNEWLTLEKLENQETVSGNTVSQDTAANISDPFGTTSEISENVSIYELELDDD
jgi:hypothetical protein